MNDVWDRIECGARMWCVHNESTSIDKSHSKRSNVDDENDTDKKKLTIEWQ